ncbi:MAG: class I SAM-dependent methyltransferase [Rhizobiaceae bacterium]|nr:class I SAM-dependent methyltransferase [Rhizobiaceae bacterium]
MGNRLFLRSTIIDTRQELTRTADKVSQIKRTLEDSLLLVEKKVDYLLAKIDAYAEVDDRNGAALHDGLAVVRQVTKDLGKIVSTNQAELRHGQYTLDARLTSIERGNADLASELAAVRQAGQDLGEAVNANREAMSPQLAAIELGNADLASELAAVRQAGQDLGEAVNATREAMSPRLAAIELGNADLASELAAVRQAGQDLGEAVNANREAMSPRLAAIELGNADLTKRLDAAIERLAAIELGNADLASELAAVRQAGQDLGEAVNANREAMSPQLAAIELGNADLASELAAVRQAGQDLGEAVNATREAMSPRLAAIELGNADLASELAAVRQAGQDLGEAVNANREAMSPRLAAIELGNADLTKRLDAAIERLARIETAHADTVANIEKSANHTVADINKNVEKTAFNEFRQHEALGTLRQLLKFDLPLPATRGWAASPDFLLHLYQHVATHRPKTVVELGSGVSTLVVAAALAANGDGGRLYSLDHDGAYAEATLKLVAQHGFPNVATVYHAPLAPWKPARPTELGEEWQWYAVPRTVKSLKAIDLLVVDGPPKTTGPHARYPAVPHFHGRLAPDGVVLLDDARRSDEQATAQAWSREKNLKLKLAVGPDDGFEKGLAILNVESETSKANSQKERRKGRKHTTPAAEK